MTAGGSGRGGYRCLKFFRGGFLACLVRQWEGGSADRVLVQYSSNAVNISPFLFQTAPFHSFVRSFTSSTSHHHRQTPIPYRHHNHSARRVAHVLTLFPSTNKLFLFPSHLSSPVLTCPHVIPVQKKMKGKKIPFPPFTFFLSHLAATRWGFREHGGTVVATFAFFVTTGARPFSAFFIFIFFLVPDSCKVLGS